jgi:hypothetical protein
MSSNNDKPNNNFNLRIYEYLLDGYTNKTTYNPYYTTKLLENNNSSCSRIKVNYTNEKIKNRYKNNIRSCDYFDGELSTKPPNKIKIILPKSSFTINYKDIEINSNELVNFTSIYGAKEKKRMKITNNIKQLYNEKFIQDIIIDYIEIIKDDWDNNIPINKTLIKYIDGTNKRFIIIGDLHGSFATFIRLLLRFKLMNIIDEKCKIQDYYNIIFLGDIIDRGIYGYEIMIITYLLKLINPKTFFINRGNHEEQEINKRYGFYTHIKTQFNNDNLYYLFNTSFNYSHSALLISNNNKYIYLAHGGLPLTQSGELYEGWIKKNNSIIDNYKISSNFINSIRWSDFHGDIKTGRNLSRGGGYIIGTDILDKVKKLGIELIIRAHQDRFYNTKILKKATKNDYDFFQKIDIKNNEKMACTDFIHKLDIQDDEININNIIKKDYLPVIVLSTNTDNGKDLNHDSFAILSFNKDDFNLERNCITEDE